VDELSEVTLDGSGSSDSDGSIASYAWSQTSPDSPGVSIANANAQTATFTAPEVNEDTEFVFELRVVDDDGDASTDAVQVTVNNNAAPMADAGADQAVDELSEVTLDGSGSSDSDGSIASYAWSQTSPDSPGVGIANASAQTATFTAPEVNEDTEFVFELRVVDDDGDASTATVRITVNDVPPPELEVVEFYQGQVIDKHPRPSGFKALPAIPGRKTVMVVRAKEAVSEGRISVEISDKDGNLLSGFDPSVVAFQPGKGLNQYAEREVVFDVTGAMADGSAVSYRVMSRGEELANTTALPGTIQGLGAFRMTFVPMNYSGEEAITKEMVEEWAPPRIALAIDRLPLQEDTAFETASPISIPQEVAENTAEYPDPLDILNDVALLSRLGFPDHLAPGPNRHLAGVHPGGLDMDACGRGFRPGTTLTLDSTCRDLGNLSHELGHNLSLKHPWDYDDGIFPYPDGVRPENAEEGPNPYDDHRGWSNIEGSQSGEGFVYVRKEVGDPPPAAWRVPHSVMGYNDLDDLEFISRFEHDLALQHRGDVNPGAQATFNVPPRIRRFYIPPPSEISERLQRNVRWGFFSPEDDNVFEPYDGGGIPVATIYYSDLNLPDDTLAWEADDDRFYFPVDPWADLRSERRQIVALKSGASLDDTAIFTVTVTDSGGLSDSAKVDIRVAPENSRAIGDSAARAAASPRWRSSSSNGAAIPPANRPAQRSVAVSGHMDQYGQWKLRFVEEVQKPPPAYSPAKSEHLLVARGPNWEVLHQQFISLSEVGHTGRYAWSASFPVPASPIIRIEVIDTSTGNELLSSPPKRSSLPKELVRQFEQSVRNATPIRMDEFEK